MRGFPKWFNVKQDVLNALAEYPEETKAFLQKCLDERFSWLVTKKLDDGNPEKLAAVQEYNSARADTLTEHLEKIGKGLDSVASLSAVATMGKGIAMEEGLEKVEESAKFEEGVVDEVSRVIEVRDDKTKEITERYQEEYMEDPNCRLFRLGFTVEEAQALLA